MKSKFFIAVFGLFLSFAAIAKTIVVIDPGHGGKDKGAIGKNIGIYEKDVVLQISKELKALFDANPNFKAVLTRDRDVFISVPERAGIARKHNADYLISIHADASPPPKDLQGASVFVLSDKRANDELGKWLENHEQKSELLGGAGKILSHNQERYLDKIVLDLQFSYAKQTAYTLAQSVLRELSKGITIFSPTPKKASLGVLRAPDIPSILVETAFLSNAEEERKLSTPAFQRKVAHAIYRGVIAHHSRMPTKSTQNTSQTKAKPEESHQKTSEKGNKAVEKEKNLTKVRKIKPVESAPETTPTNRVKVLDPNASFHIVQQDETLYAIARAYKTTPEKLSKLNNIKDNKITVGKKLKLK